MRRAIPALLALALSLTACQSTTQTASSPVHPALSAAPAMSPVQTPAVAMTAGFKVSDVQEAEKVYREFLTAYWKMSGTAPRDQSAAGLQTYLDDPLLLSVKAAVKFQVEEGITASPASGRILSLSPKESESYEDSVVALEACTDERGITFRRADGASKRGRLVRELAFFHVDAHGDMKYFANRSLKEINKCLGS